MVYDLIVIGGGPVGLVASKLAAGLNRKVALIERDKLGGECTLTGCIPSKTLIHYAQVIHYARKAESLGIKADFTGLDTTFILEKIRQTVDEIYSTHTPDILCASGIDVLFGEPVFQDPFTLVLNNCTLRAKKYLIATGSRPLIPPIEGINNVSYLTNRNLFALSQLPQSMLILGGGPIGVELGQALHRLGTRVTIVELNDNILFKEDPELTAILREHLMQEGIILATGIKATKVVCNNGYISLACEDKENNKYDLQAEKLLVAVGRRPNIEGLGLESIGITADSKGIRVNSALQTAVSHIYACGDVIGPYQFSHMAEYQARIAVRNALFPLFKQHVDYRHKVWVTFTNPELATAGLNEQEARAQYGEDIKIYQQAYKETDRGKTDEALSGHAKFICDKKGYILGATILGARAGELIGEIQLGSYYKHKLGDLYFVIHPYPTYLEVIKHAAKRAYIDSIQSKRWLSWVAYMLGYRKK